MKVSHTTSQKAVEQSERIAKIQAASPTARDLVDALGADGLYVITPAGLRVPGWVDDFGIVHPSGEWRYRPCSPAYSEDVNRRRYGIFKELMAGRRRLQNDDILENEQKSVTFRDKDGMKRMVPEANADEAQRLHGERKIIVRG